MRPRGPGIIASSRLIHATRSHEALVSQWPRYQTWLSVRDPDGSDRAADKRALDALTQRAVGWAAASNKRTKAKWWATGADLDAFVSLARRRPTWLSADEHKLVSNSRKAARMHSRLVLLTQLVFMAVGIGSGIVGFLNNEPINERDVGTAWRIATEVPKDDAEAARWAADQGIAEQQLALGLRYADGRGVPQDDAEAVRWFRKAADHFSCNDTAWQRCFRVTTAADRSSRRRSSPSV